MLLNTGNRAIWAIRQVLLLSLFIVFAQLLHASVLPIGGHHKICYDSHVTLTDSTVGGIWSSADTSIVTIDSTGRAFGVSIGSTYITYTSGSSYVTQEVTVEPLPNRYPVTGGGGLCAGSRVALPVNVAQSDTGTVYYAIMVGGTGYGPTVAGDGLELNLGYYTTPGVYEVIAFGRNTGCYVEMDSAVQITALASPSDVVAPDNICEGSSGSCSDSAGGGIWVVSNSGIAAIDSFSGVITGISGGEVSISYILPDGCVARKPLDVLPISDPVLSYDDTTETIYVTPSYNTYQWYDSVSGLISGATSASIAVTSMQYYYVAVTATNGCSRISGRFDPRTVEGVPQAPKTVGILVFPNPVVGRLSLSSEGNIGDIAIIDASGRVVLELVAPGRNALIDMARYSTGVYLVAVNGQVLTKFVKE
jgi:Secretion system C-terminal sorting domain